MKRSKWIACILLLAVAAYLGAVGVVWFTRPTPGITEENALLLRRGMTLQRGEALFGSIGLKSEIRCLNDNDGSKHYCWYGEKVVVDHFPDRIIVVACFDNSGTLTSAGFANEALRVAMISQGNRSTRLFTGVALALN